MNKPIKRAAVIHDLCGIGKAALTNVIPVLATMGIEACPIPTIILSTHTGGFNKPAIVKLEGYISQAVNHYKEQGISFEGIFIGYLGSIENINETLMLLEAVKNENSMIVFDPIFGDNGHFYSNFDKSYSNKLKELAKYAKVMTPNFTEACILAEEEIIDEIDDEKLLKLSKKLHGLGCENIIITSVPLKDKNKIGTSVYNGKKDLIELIVCDRIEKSYPGTGDIFTSVLIGSILNGFDLIESVKKSCKFVEKAIKTSSQYDYPTKEGVLLEKVLTTLND
ncbi:pyridoxamine kinase [Clostridium sp. C2-6-12]|uniref:pyridoxamine kinase n=1 Tax=Clostridium sp. C2-6-12 TaxID=2698832 RepID=UPI00136A57EF|nr:pyridoxamine kinase [Clostridium sp. C2-6-12]